MKHATLYVGFATLIFMIAGCGGGQAAAAFTPAEYIRATGSASPGEETRIELEDGAAIVIPANSIRAEISILVERNPEKANSPPALYLYFLWSYSVTIIESSTQSILVLPAPPGKIT